ncbi:MAG TPA: cytochrome c [Thermoanaerobaculia bacterium]|nr:cytochrome c [Thermoanaerobaculia bacterium]
MPRNKPAWVALASAVCLMCVLTGCARKEDEAAIPAEEPVPDTVGKIVSLDQGWTEEEQQWFWFTSQGSRLIPYDWFLVLEQADSTEPFRSDANMERLRYLVEKPGALNLDGLPVGFAKDTDEHGQPWMGFTCAGCHTTQIDYKGTGIRIDGGGTLADTMGFMSGLGEATRATVDDNAKFERFARKLLGVGYSTAAAETLRRALFERAEYLLEWVDKNSPPHPWGFARLDAFGGIFNMVTAYDLGVPENYRPGDAPVSIPFLWDTPQSDLVQWDGIAPNFPPGVGPLARNVGEVLGVFATVAIEPGAGLRGYKSSARALAQGELEEKLTKLWSPLWPMEHLPPLDPAKAERGSEIYQQQCASCHAILDRTNPKRRIDAVMTPVGEIGTDPTMANNVVQRTAKTGKLQGTKMYVVAGDPFGPEAPASEVLTNVVIGTMLGEKKESVEGAIDDYLKVKKASTPATPSYKGRPMNGIWATAPYLHNGSVPNLWQLLQAPEARVKQFHVGSRELDPVNVGFDTAASPGSFLFDAGLPGNSNAGHAFGTQLTDEQKWELIEFLKSL